MLDIDCGAQATGVFCYVIAEDDRAHRGLAAAGLALLKSQSVLSDRGPRKLQTYHQQNLLLVAGAFPFLHAHFDELIEL